MDDDIKNNPFNLVISPIANSIRGAVTMQIKVPRYSLFFVHNQAIIRRKNSVTPRPVAFLTQRCLSLLLLLLLLLLLVSAPASASTSKVKNSLSYTVFS